MKYLLKSFFTLMLTIIAILFMSFLLRMKDEMIFSSFNEILVFIIAPIACCCLIIHLIKYINCTPLEKEITITETINKDFWKKNYSLKDEENTEYALFEINKTDFENLKFNKKYKIKYKLINKDYFIIDIKII